MNVSQEIFSRQEKPSIQGQYVCQESENKGRGAVSLFRWGEALITSTGAVKCWIRQEKCHNWQG